MDGACLVPDLVGSAACLVPVEVGAPACVVPVEVGLVPGRGGPEGAACLAPDGLVLLVPGPGPVGGGDDGLPWRRADLRILDRRWSSWLREVTFTLVKLNGLMLMGKCLNQPVFIARAQESSRIEYFEI